jgi:hypothetical protein
VRLVCLTFLALVAAPCGPSLSSAQSAAATQLQGTAGTVVGKPFGPFNLYSSSTSIRSGPWTLTIQSSSPSGIVSQIEAARAQHIRLIVAMTGGAHKKYITQGQFDLSKWKSIQSSYDTPAIREAIDAAVQDGTLIGASVLDEPNHPSWGGAITPALLDGMSEYVKTMFPTLKTATVGQWDWQPTVAYASLDFLIAQYSYRLGPLSVYIDSSTVTTKRRGLGLMFSMNVLDGGARVRPCPAGKSDPTTVNCMMTATELAQAGKALLASQGCGLLLWQYNDDFFNRQENAEVFAELAAYAAHQLVPPCRRT